MAWTDEQRRAIDLDGNLIVSAAAGAGKTAVLTERIVSRILAGASVDEMLVLTFTRAAASEMKGRILSRLRLAASEAEGKERKRLRAEADRVGTSYISTVHAFCGRVLRRHAAKLGIAPDFRVADEMESAALSEQVRDQLLNTLAAEDNVDWIRLITAFRGEENAFSAVLAVSTFLESEPEPERWLDDARDRLTSDTGTDKLLSDAVALLKEEVAMAVRSLSAVRDTIPPDWPMTAGTIDDDLMQCRALLLMNDYASYRQGISDLTFSRLNFPKGTADEEKLFVRDPRDRLKKRIKAQRELMSRTADDERETLRRTGVVLSSLVQIVSAYRSAFYDARHERGILSYSDLEHEALKCLRFPDVAAEYREKFRFIAVDEYQDSNRVQDAIVNAIRRENNLFFVGDVKQSIYRFRRAEPTLFLEKLASFSGEAGTRIDLNANFRSCPDVLLAANDVFRAIMTETAGEIDYDSRAMLRPGGNVTDAGGAELAIIEKELDTDGEDADSVLLDAADAEVEARFIAERIRRILSEETVTDRSTGRTRQPTYADIAILIRSTTHAQVIAEALSRAGIPCYAQLNGGYFDALEVQIMLNLLAIIDNRRQDVPLLSILLSGIGGFTPKELVAVRSACEGSAFYDAFLAAPEADALDTAIREKCAAFLARLDRWHEESLLLPTDTLLSRLYDETGFYDEVGASAGGGRRQANLDALLLKARVFSSASGHGIWSFLRRIALVKNSVSVGASETLAADVVRILTIHKSKGLEFPFVFLMQMGARFSFNGGKRPPDVLLHDALGIGLRFVSEGRRVEPLSYRIIAARQRREQLAEEMRVLYVAMTRAMKRLILVASKHNAEDSTVPSEVVPTPLNVLSASSPLDWLLLAPRGHLPLTVYPREAYLDAERPETSPRLPAPDPAVVQALKSTFSWVYPHASATALPNKASVSRVTGMAEGIDVHPATFDEPAFLSGSRRGGVFLGTAAHIVLQQLPLDGSVTADTLPAWLDTLCTRGILDAEQREAVSPKLFRWFLDDPLFLRMRKSPRTERELTFGYAMDAKRMMRTDADERVFLQGVIDCCFLEDGAWVLLDYKTDRILPGETAETTAKKHIPQLTLYAEALSRLTGRDVKESYVVLLAAEACVRVG